MEINIYMRVFFPRAMFIRESNTLKLFLSLLLRLMRTAHTRFTPIHTYLTPGFWSFFFHYSLSLFSEVLNEDNGVLILHGDWLIEQMK